MPTLTISSTEPPCWISKQYTIPQLAERYRARWGVEEWYKVSKQRMEVEDFHGPSERGVKQKLYAGFPLNAMTRRFSGHGDHRWNESPHEHGKPRKQDPFQARTGDGGGRHREPVAEAGIRATRKRSPRWFATSSDADNDSGPADPSNDDPENP